MTRKRTFTIQGTEVVVTFDEDHAAGVVVLRATWKTPTGTKMGLQNATSLYSSRGADRTPLDDLLRAVEEEIRDGGSREIQFLKQRHESETAALNKALKDARSEHRRLVILTNQKDDEIKALRADLEAEPYDCAPQGPEWEELHQQIGALNERAAIYAGRLALMTADLEDEKAKNATLQQQLGEWMTAYVAKNPEEQIEETPVPGRDWVSLAWAAVSTAAAVGGLWTAYISMVF